jgi:pectate lyase
VAAFFGAATSSLRAADLGRETLRPGDGWASSSTGTTGGSAAAPDHVFTVTNRQELVAALAFPDATPRIVYVAGTIDANVDDANNPLTCADYARNGYTLPEYLATYDPAVWGRVLPSGPLEAARVASQQAQQGRVRIRIGSNTTIVGIDKTAVVRGAWFDIRNNAANIIIRNLKFQDTFDCFPQWDPTDGSLGNWNSQYDSISLRTATHVWIDHNTFEDRDTADAGQPLYFGRLFQVHDGAVDITNASDLATVSWNRFLSHDKVMLIGSSDSATADRGKLRVTIHHNLFDDVGQRTPRVRFGQVHVYNNYYKVHNLESYVYSWGVGIESAIFAENNFFWPDDAVTPDRFISALKGTAIHESGTLVGGPADKNQVSVLDAYNAANDPDLLGDVGWTPTLFLEIDPTRSVLPVVQSHAGPFDPEDE